MAEISNTPYATPVAPSTATLTAGMSATDARTILNNLGINVNDVLSGSNIQQTIATPTPKPDDLLGIRADIYNTNGVNQSQTDYQAATKAYMDAQSTLNSQNLQLGGRTVSMSKITGQQAQNTQTSAQNITNLQNAAQLKLQEYQAKKQEADTQFEIKNAEIGQKRTLQAQYAGAGIKLTDSFDDAFKKIDKYAKKQKDEAYKDELKKMALSLGVKTSGSSKELEKRISAENKGALADAKYTANLKNQQILADIANTKSTIANRGKDESKPLDMSNNGLAKIIEEEANNGTSWADIAAKLTAATGNAAAVSNGSFADKYLNYIFGQSTDNPLTSKSE